LQSNIETNGTDKVASERLPLHGVPAK